MKCLYLIIFLLLYLSPGLPQACIPFEYGGKIYHPIQIGDQCWLKENLDIGKMINSVTGGSNGNGRQTDNDTIEKYCYNDIPANCDIYGGLYTWDEAMQYVTSEGARGICPPGWHIPTDAELITLGTTVGSSSNSLKAIGVGTGAGAGTNISGFSALLAGYYIGWFIPPFGRIDSGATFWSSTQYNSTDAYLIQLYQSNDYIFYGEADKKAAYSIRCIYDLDVCPVELNLFNAVPNERTVQLNWETKTEKNSNKFTIERRLSGTQWATIGSVTAANLSNSPKQYRFSDRNLQAGRYAYRLKMIDNDGTFDYSKIVEIEVAVPGNFELSQNYPNPFNPTTKINYTLPFDSKVTMEVYNLNGIKICQLVNEDQSAGYFSVDFNSASLKGALSSGVYFYHLIAIDKLGRNNFSSIKKMILLK
jgi:uncharacterized protein (TIGR02145 family)